MARPAPSPGFGEETSELICAEGTAFAAAFERTNLSDINTRRQQAARYRNGLVLRRANP